MRILVVTTQVPFIRGGAEIHADGLIHALRSVGHEAELVTIPFKGYPPDQILDHMLACRLIDLSESCGQKIDKVVCMKFPAYLVPHPQKVVWLLHQYREAYELWGTKYSDLINFANGLQIRDAIINADKKAFQECISIFTNSKNVAKRLKKFNQINAAPLYHPPQNAEAFYCDSNVEDYLFFPSRLTPIKRQHLVIEALSKTSKPVKVLFSGKADNREYVVHLENLIKELGVAERAILLGEIGETEKIKYYAQALGVIYPPFDEDYGYVTLEAMLSSKPLITCTDSGGTLEFVHHEKTGLVSEPEPQLFADALDQLWSYPDWATSLGKEARVYYNTLNITWSNVIQKLLL